MSRFKVGDKVRCVQNATQLTVGAEYTIVSVCLDGCWYRVFNDLNSVAGYGAAKFELVQDDVVLTPEEVFKHLRKGTKLQHLHGNHGWKDVTTPNELYYEDICNEKFRIKPEPEIITLNGKRYQALED